MQKSKVELYDVICWECDTSCKQNWLCSNTSLDCPRALGVTNATEESSCVLQEHNDYGKRVTYICILYVICWSCSPLFLVLHGPTQLNMTRVEWAHAPSDHHIPEDLTYYNRNNHCNSFQCSILCGNDKSAGFLKSCVWSSTMLACDWGMNMILDASEL